MASSLQNLSSQKVNQRDHSQTKVAIVVAEWNSVVTEALYAGAYERLIREGIKKENIIRKDVPGSFELTIGCQWIASQADVSGVIALGCVIMGDTPHFDYICQAVSYGITEASLRSNKAIIFGVLTTLDQQQALDRAGGKHGNKGDEAAATLLKMLDF